jgi:hypothetical protein
LAALDGGGYAIFAVLVFRYVSATLSSIVQIHPAANEPKIRKYFDISNIQFLYIYKRANCRNVANMIVG